MPRCLDVEGHDSGPGLDVGKHLLERLGDHEVDVFDEAVRNRLDDRRPDRRHRTEHTVHDVHVNELDACLVERGQLLAELQ